MRSAVLVFLVMAGAALSGCSKDHAGTASGAAAAAKPKPPAATVSIRPGKAGTIMRPQRGIIVRAAHGTLSDVVVRSQGDEVEGTLNAARTVWRTKWALGVSRRYRVTATAQGNDGQPVTAKRSYRTLTPKQTFAPRTIMTEGATYGVGMPLIFYFDDPAVNRKAVERSLELRTSKKVVGSWYWSETCGIVPLCLYFRPKTYWKPHTKVRWAMHADGVQMKPGVFGAADLNGSITIGRELKVVASTGKHIARIYKNGKQYAQWPISTGKPGDDTPNGTYLSIEKHNPERMVGEDYDMSVPFSVRITWSGVYLHAAPWSVGAQGSSNVSHGCINLSPENAATYYDMSIPGDPVTVRGSSRSGTFDNGWTMWFKSWKKWKQGSALGQVVHAGRHGSTFV